MFFTIRRLCIVGSAIVLAACGGGNDAAPDASPLREQPVAIAAPSQSVWSPPVALPLVPTTAAVLPDGKVLLWSAEERFSFGANVGRTYTVTFDPATNTSSERTGTESAHNMSSPGTTNRAA